MSPAGRTTRMLSGFAPPRIIVRYMALRQMGALPDRPVRSRITCRPVGPDHPSSIHACRTSR